MTSEVKAPVGQLARSADELSRSADETRERLSRRDDRFRGVEELLSAASGLARTIAATEELDRVGALLQDHARSWCEHGARSAVRGPTATVAR